jgi:hypothetical protein
MTRVWLLLLTAAMGCGDDPWSAEVHGAEKARDLPLLEDVEVIEMSREEFAAQAAANANEITDEQLAYYADTYGRLGFFPRDLDLRPVFAGSSSDWVGAQYSPSRKLITLVGDVRPDITVHEFVHAIQDQHFDLRAFDTTATSDGFLGRRAVTEGDARLAQVRYIGQSQYGYDLDRVSWADLFASGREQSLASLADDAYPVLFRDYVSFVYTYGMEYVAANLTGATFDAPNPFPAPYDWRLQDALFTTRPPSTTQDILRRRDVDAVESVGLEEVPAELVRYETVEWDSLGEWYSYLLFYPVELPAGATYGDTRALAAAWDGDRALFVRDVELDRMGVVWASMWDDDEAAAQVAAMSRTLHGFVADDGTPTQGRGSDGQSAWIEQRGRRVVVARNLDPVAGAELVEAAFGPVTTARARQRPSIAATLDRIRRPLVRARGFDQGTSTRGRR